ncbi:MAG: Hsp70 family protein [Synergistaceae bacterium]|nr:Hsp70 family protein [Synergistaceae bacterium]
MHYVGLDLGTTNSVICSYDGINAPRVWKSPEQNDVTPSAIYIGRRGGRYYGHKAYNRSALDDKNTAVLFKRFLGTSAKFGFPDAGIFLSP